MERRLKSILICVILGGVLFLNLQAQDNRNTKSKILVDQYIKDFTVKRSESDRALAFNHPVRLKIKTIGDLDAVGMTTLRIRIETENWYTVPDRPSTYYLKEFRARLIASPGAIEVETPTIELFGPNKEKSAYSYNTPDHEVSSFMRNGGHYEEFRDLESFSELNGIMTLPFCIPAFGDTEVRIRAFEMRIPMEIKRAEIPLKLVIDRIALGYFGDNEDSYPTPLAVNQEFKLVEGEAGYLPADPGVINSILRFDPVLDSLSNITWGLNASFSGKTDEANLNLVLTHDSPGQFMGVKKVEFGMITNDGVLEIRDALTISYPDGSGFSGDEGISLFTLPSEDESYPCPSMLRAYARLSVSKDIQISDANDLYDYPSLLTRLWSNENNYDLFAFPEQNSQWNYPVSDNRGELHLDIPCSLHGEGVKDGMLFAHLDILYGESKSALKKGSIVLIYSTLHPDLPIQSFVIHYDDTIPRMPYY